MAHNLFLGDDGSIQADGYSGTVDLGSLQRTSLTDNTGGTAVTTFAAGVGIEVVSFFTNLADIAAGDLFTTYTPGFRFKLLGLHAVVAKPATTAAKAATGTLKMSGVATTGGVLSLTSANMTPAGNVVAASAITALNVGAATDTISLTWSAVTTFIEGNANILLRIQNMDTADAVAGMAALLQKNT